ncbi:hypothetical protein Tco_0010088 [Tanacetum coccineum]
MENLDFCDKHNMVAYLQKSEGSEGFHQIVDFLNTCHIKYALNENPIIYVSFIEQFWQTASASTLENGDIEITVIIDGKVKVVSEASFRIHLKLEYYDGISTLPTTEIFEQFALMGSPTQTHVADKAASTGVDDRHRGAVTTVFGLEAGQGSVLENDLKQTKKTYGAAFTKLIKKVKALEKTIKSTKARKRAQFVESDDKEEDSFNQGRKIAKIDEDPDISLFIAPEEVHTVDPNISTANVPVSTAGAKVSTAAESLVYIKRSAAKRKDKGKAIVEESEPTQTKTNIQKEQERLGLEEAQRLQEQYDKEERQRIANVYKEAREGSEPAEESKDKELYELSQEQLQQLIIIVPEEGMNVEALQTKYPIIDWENFDRDNLVKLWDLVRKRFSSTEPTDDKERALWVELKKLFEPDTDNL